MAIVDDRSTGGELTCHVALSPDAQWVAAANYGDGSVAVYPLGADGIPAAEAQVLRHAGSGPVPDRQAGPHCHQVTFDGMMLTVTDLGADRIRRHVLDGTQWVPASVGDVALEAGSGPRHQVIDGDLRYVVGELGGAVMCYRVEATTGAWTEVGRAATTEHDGENLPSHIVLRDGHLYVGNRGADTIAVLTVADGVPALLGETPTGGVWPRHFAFVDSRIVVANERSHELTVLDVPAGSPLPVASGVVLRTGSPTCVLPLS
jgi:6-phosphogluconolactonase (cycloisomerase 2 family)